MSNENLRESARRPPKWVDATFRLLMDAAPDAMLVADHSGVIILANAQAEKLFGYTRDELVGNLIELLVPVSLQSQHSQHRKLFFHDAKPRPMGTGLELSARRRDGSEVPVEISLSPFVTNDETYVTAAIRDISDRKAAEREIRKLNAELKKKVGDLASTNRELESYSYSISHDLRAPLRQIDGFSKILLDEAFETLSPEQRENLQQIRNGTRQLGLLVDGLLNLSRLGRQALVPQVVSMNALVRTVIGEMAREIELCGRQVEWRIDHIPNAVCDCTLMRQVFRNLISNAVKFTKTRQKAIVEVGYTKESHPPAYFIRDNGVGFDMKYADKLFGVFQRLHLQEQFEGTGVGLATVQRIVLKHGGEVWASADEGRGATFFFTVGEDLATAPQEMDGQP